PRLYVLSAGGRRLFLLPAAPVLACASWVLFFFRSEDGIRYDLVTGVQTCALPIYQMMGDVVAAKRQCVFISGPIAFHQFRLESLLLEKAFLVSRVNRSFAGQPDIADTDFI